MQRKKMILYGVAAVVLILGILFFYRYRIKFGKVISPFFMAIIIAYLLNPLAKKLQNKGIPCYASILLIYLFFSLILFTTVVFVFPVIINNTRDLTNTLPDITTRYESLFTNIMSGIQASNWPADVKATIFKEVQNGTQIAQDYLVDLLKKSLTTLLETVSALFDLILAMIIAYYLIKDAHFFRELVLSLVPRRWRNGMINTGRQVNGILSNFIQGQILTAFIVGIMEAIGLFIIKVKYPLILGLVGGLANIIPYFGPFLGAIPAVAVALIESPVKALWTVLVFTVVQQIDNAFISPKIIEGRLGLHPVTTILAVLVGGEFYGILGMLIAVPVTAIVKVLLKGMVEAIV